MGDVIVHDVWSHTITFCPVLIESGSDGERRENYSTSRYLSTVGVLGARWYSCPLQEAHVVGKREASLCLETVCY